MAETKEKFDVNFDGDEINYIGQCSKETKAELKAMNGKITIKGKEYEITEHHLRFMKHSSYYREQCDLKALSLKKDKLLEEKESVAEKDPSDVVYESVDEPIKKENKKLKTNVQEAICKLNKLDPSLIMDNNPLDKEFHMRDIEHIEHGNFYPDRFNMSESMLPNVRKFYEDVKPQRYFDWYEKYEVYMNKYGISLFDFMSIRQYIYNRKIQAVYKKNKHHLSTVIIYTVDGVMHREHGPAYIENEGELIAYCKEGLIHSYDDQPALIADSCMLHFWAQNGKFHRESPKPFYVGLTTGITVDGVKYWVYSDDKYELFDWSDDVSKSYPLDFA